MKQIWSPWRAKHLEQLASSAPDSSIFLRLVEEDQDEDNFILFRGRYAFVIMNLYPYTNGHLLIVPFRPVSTYLELTSDERGEAGDLIADCMRWLNVSLQPEGFNVGLNEGVAGGAGIPGHLHFHVLPRWSADTNFMSTTSATRVISESLTETYRKLRAAIDSDPSPCQPESGT